MNKTTYRKASELCDYSSHSFDNKYLVNKISFKKKVHCYCRLGGDCYTNNLEVSFNPGDIICDYVYLDKAIEERFEQSDSIIEEVLYGVYEIIKNQCPNSTDINIKSTIIDSVPKDMPLTVEIIKYK